MRHALMAAQHSNYQYTNLKVQVQKYDSKETPWSTTCTCNPRKLPLVNAIIHKSFHPSISVIQSLCFPYNSAPAVHDHSLYMVMACKACSIDSPNKPPCRSQLTNDGEPYCNCWGFVGVLELMATWGRRFRHSLKRRRYDHSFAHLGRPGGYSMHTQQPA